jgi:hypothetical protein
MKLDNGTLQLTLDNAQTRVPQISRAMWSSNGKPVFINATTQQDLTAWLPEDLIPPENGEIAWRAIEHTAFLHAEATKELAHGLVVTWTVDLAREGSLFRTQIKLKNAGDSPHKVNWFPIWCDAWETKAESLTWWEALSFEAVTLPLNGPREVTLDSRLHSSDNRQSEGVNPYWLVKGSDSALYFGLDWCGGWRAELEAGPDRFDFKLLLPPEETQLTLAPGETMNGPAMMVTAADEADLPSNRATWMRQRAALAKRLYGGPDPSFPFAYNNWYTTRFDLSPDFLRRQIEAMEPYQFDFFVIDAGWYAGCGQWVPDPNKFAENEFENLLEEAGSKGADVGIWTCPQFVKAPEDALPPEIDQPGFYERFIDGHLLDLAGSGFDAFLLDHMAALRSRYGIDWWKYDQALFTEETRHGVMKNVTAFQNALLSVRKAHPDLFIENCQSGGRMINEFTTLVAQAHWIRDGGNTGPDHARSNFKEALGAIEFLPPWTAMRWTNNPDRNDPNDDAFTRRYCRSAMAGAWGLVADLAKIEARQRGIILQEVNHYRRLSELKMSCRYDIIPAQDGAPVAGVVFFDTAGTRAGILLLRWDTEGTIDWTIPLTGLNAPRKARIEDVDTGQKTEVDGPQLLENGLTVHFDPARQSALVFVEAFE